MLSNRMEASDTCQQSGISGFLIYNYLCILRDIMIQISYNVFISPPRVSVLFIIVRLISVLDIRNISKSIIQKKVYS